MAGNETNSERIKEGLAEVYTTSAFYNPVQQFNRDTTISVITEYLRTNKNKNIRLLEALAASGLRSIRFAKEISGISEIICNDFSEEAVECIKKNIELNGVGSIVKPNCEDAMLLMQRCKKKEFQFDIVDLDPYGCAGPFLDGAVQCIKNGGLLAVTCTDLAILCGNAFESCHAKYGSVSLKSKACHEIALRIVLRSIESAANRYGRYIEPLVSISVDFYVRIFVKVHYGMQQAKKSICKLSMIYQCSGCSSLHFQPLATSKTEHTFAFARGPPVSEVCAFCSHKFHLGGPIWSDRIHNLEFISQSLESLKNLENLGTKERIQGIFNVIKEELPDVPLYYVLDSLASTLRCSAPSQNAFRSAILNAGYKVSYSHAEKNSVKTNAPMSLLWDVLRSWVKKNPINDRHMTDGSVVKEILSKEPLASIEFDFHAQAIPDSKKMGLLRWQKNPQPEWGPKTRAKKSNETQAEKRERNQGKRKRRKIEQS